MTKHFDLFVNNDPRTFLSDVHLHKYLLLRDKRNISNHLQAFVSNLLRGAVCTNCFEKCTYFANIKNDWRNAKRLRKTNVISLMSVMIQSC